MKSYFLAVFALFVAVLLVTLLDARALASTPPLFLPPVTYNTGGFNPWSVSIADVNGDAILDLIVANQGEVGVNSKGSVGVLLGNGGGIFQPAMNYDSDGAGANSVAVADLNGDDKPDLVVANSCALGTFCSPEGVLHVLLGNGDGTFQAAHSYGSGSFDFLGSYVAIADVNGDGKPDLIVANPCEDTICTNGSVSILLGNGDGTFQSAITYTSGGHDALSVAVADVNGDGRPDLLVANYCTNLCVYPFFTPTEGGVGVLLGNGDGTFQAAVTYSSGGDGTRSITTADVNGDGNADVLTASCGPGLGGCGPGSPGGTVGVLLGKGDGTFQTVVSYEAANSPISVAVADINGDGKPDLVVGNWGTSNAGSNDGAVSVLLGNGNGTFQPAITFLSGGNEVPSIAVADLNADGRQDIVAASYGSNGTNPPPGIVSVLLNNTPSCTSPPVVAISTTPASLWPPNGKMVPVTVSGTITDIGCTVTSAAYTVRDEYAEVQPMGAITLGPGGNYSFRVLLQASRRGSDLDGRRYTITVRAKDNAGNGGSKTSAVTVPHDHED